jgi:hypothetical protein
MQLRMSAAELRLAPSVPSCHLTAHHCKVVCSGTATVQQGGMSTRSSCMAWTAAAVAWWACSRRARCSPALFFCTKGAPEALTLLGASGVSCMGVAPGSSGMAGDCAGGVMMAGVLLKGCCMRTEPASARACRQLTLASTLLARSWHFTGSVTHRL